MAMAYDEDTLYKLAFEQIKKYKPHNLGTLVQLMGISYDTYYRRFPVGSEKSEQIKRALQLEKGEMFSVIINKSFQSDTPTDRAILLKLYGDNETRRKLSTNYQEITGKDGEPIQVDPFARIRENNDIDRKAEDSD